MKAVGYHNSLLIEAPEALLDIELSQPIATGRGLWVKVDAIAVNPVDYKIRQRMAPVDQAYWMPCYPVGRVNRCNADQ